MKMKGVILGVIVLSAFLAQFASAQQDTLNLENDAYSVTINSSQTLAITSLVHNRANENILKDPAAATLFSIQIEDDTYTPRDFAISGFLQEDTGITFQLVPVEETVPLSVSVRFADTEWGELSIRLSVTNTTNEDIGEVVTTFPIIGGIRFGDTQADEMLFLPRYHGMLASEVDGQYPYGCSCYWQIVDLYNEEKGYGIYFRIADSTGDYKRFEMHKKNDENNFSFATHYCEKPLPAGATLTYPAVALGFHEGNWRTALDTYMKWVKTWYQRRPTPKWFKQRFLIRPEALHDYPGVWPFGYKDESSLAYDEKNDKYRIAERYYDMLPTVEYDIFHFWRWWDGSWGQTRHGDYYFPPLRGGEEAFKEYISKLQKEEDLKFTLYFEGYLLAKETYGGHKYGQKWSIKNKDGSYISDWGENYWYCCVSVPEWQDFLVEATMRIVRQTGINGVYIDSITAWPPKLCYNPDHNHPNPGVYDQGIAQLFTKLRAAFDEINPDMVLFSEAQHSDYISQFLDGSLGPTALWAKEKDKPYRKPAVNFFRFYFPDSKIYTIPSYYPTAEHLMAELFNGNGMYVQYIPEDSTYFEDPNHLPDGINAIKKISEVYHENAGTFSSDDVYPLVPTLIEKVYANRFSSPGKTIYTFQNATGTDIENQNVIALDAKPGYHYVDILRKRPVSSVTADGTTKVAIHIKSDEVAAIAEVPEILTLDEATGSITLLKPVSGVKIVTSLIDDDGNIAQPVDAIDEAGTYIVKLIDADGQLVDALVIHKD